VPAASLEGTWAGAAGDGGGSAGERGGVRRLRHPPSASGASAVAVRGLLYFFSHTVDLEDV